MMKRKLFVLACAACGLATIFPSFLAVPIVRAQDASSSTPAAMDVWWPVEGARVSGVQPIKALVKDRAVDTYSMAWQVDDGQGVDMPTNMQDYPHKEASIDYSNWFWKGNGPYTITFAAMSDGQEISRRSVSIMIDRPDIATAVATAGGSESSQPASSSETSSLIASVSSQSGMTDSAPVVSSFSSYSSSAAISSVATASLMSSSSSLGSQVSSRMLVASSDSSLSSQQSSGGMQIEIVSSSSSQMTSSSSSSTAPAQPVQSVQKLLPIDIWWPLGGAVLSGTQPLKAIVQGKPISLYTMEWQVDNGLLQPMQNSYQDYPHKEAMVDVTSWNWRGEGPYTVRFVAKNEKDVPFAQSSVTIKVIGYTPAPASQASPAVSSSSSVKVASSSTVSQAASVAPVVVSSTDNPLANAKIYMNPNSNAKRTANEWRSARPQDAAAMDKIAEGGEGMWFGNWNGNVNNDVRNAVSSAASQGMVPVLVAYNIPLRDCGGYSANGLNSPEGYRQWIRAFADGIGNNKAAVILEPDALAAMDCLSEEQKRQRMELLKDAVSVLRAKSGVAVYLDAGHPKWVDPAEIASRLTQANIGQADGFSLNVSNFHNDGDNVDYGQKVSALTGNKHFVVDTSRNGAGSNGEWCNPAGRALGRKPTSATGNPLVDAYLWIKTPGESDGSCNGAPGAGQWWADYALGLAQRAGW